MGLSPPKMKILESPLVWTTTDCFYKDTTLVKNTASYISHPNIVRKTLIFKALWNDKHPSYSHEWYENKYKSVLFSSWGEIRQTFPDRIREDDHLPTDRTVFVFYSGFHRFCKILRAWQSTGSASSHAPFGSREGCWWSCRRLFSTKWTREILWTDNTRKTQCWVNRTGQAFPFIFLVEFGRHITCNSKQN